MTCPVGTGPAHPYSAAAIQPLLRVADARKMGLM